MNAGGQDIVLPIVEDIIEQHDVMIRRFSGAPGIRDMGLLDSAVGRVGNAIAYAADMNARGAAALLCWTVVKNHPFFDGNKRAGYGALVTTLAANGMRLDPNLTDDEIADTIIEIASGDRDVDAFQDWVASHAVVDSTHRVLVEHDTGPADAKPEDPPGGPAGPGF